MVLLDRWVPKGPREKKEIPVIQGRKVHRGKSDLREKLDHRVLQE